MKKENLEDYEIFYMEMPQADYLGDIEIQDEYETSEYDKIQGLSEEQVSEIARDSLSAAGDPQAENIDRSNATGQEPS